MFHLRGRRSAFGATYRPAVAAAVMATAVVAAGCGSSSSSTPAANVNPTAAIPGITKAEIAAANKEGKLQVYTGTWQPSETALISAFEKRYPKIKVTNYTATVGQLVQRYTAEANSGHTVADIIQNSNPGQLTQEAKQGLLMHYVSSQDSAYAPNMKERGYWYPIRLALIGIAWNTSKVSTSQSSAITGVASLTAPKWNGKLGIVNPNGGGVDLAPFYLWLNDPSLGKSFLQKLAATKPRVYDSTNSASAALASGAISVLVNGSETGLEPLYGKGAPLEWKFTDPAWGLPTGQAITAHAPDPAAAKLFEDYSLSAQGAAIFQAHGGAPARTGLKDGRQVAKASWYHLPTRLASVNEADMAKQENSILSLFNKLFQ